MHAVLQVETDHGTWVLDNRMRYPRLWTRMIGTRWLWREKPGSEKWERLAGPGPQQKTIGNADKRG